MNERMETSVRDVFAAGDCCQVVFSERLLQTERSVERGRASSEQEIKSVASDYEDDEKQMKNAVHYTSEDSVQDICMLESSTDLDGIESRNGEPPLSKLDANISNQDSTVYKNWFQMRLWGQAKFLGVLAARSMFKRSRYAHADGGILSSDADEIDNDDDFACGMFFELFTHVTHFFGFKVHLVIVLNVI